MLQLVHLSLDFEVLGQLAERVEREVGVERVVNQGLQVVEKETGQDASCVRSLHLTVCKGSFVKVLLSSRFSYSH